MERPHFCPGRLSIIKLSILPKNISKFNVIPIKYQQFFLKPDKLNSKVHVKKNKEIKTLRKTQKSNISGFVEADTKTY